MVLFAIEGRIVEVRNAGVRDIAPRAPAQAQEGDAVINTQSENAPGSCSASLENHCALVCVLSHGESDKSGKDGIRKSEFVTELFA